jgi:hypothetical protein
MAVHLSVLSPNKCFKTTAQPKHRIGGAKAEAWLETTNRVLAMKITVHNRSL